MGETSNAEAVREEKSELEIFAEGTLLLASIIGAGIFIVTYAFGCNPYRPIGDEGKIYSPSYQTNNNFMWR